MNHIVYPAVKALIQRDGKFLIVKQVLKDKTIWDFPGGRVDYGESPYETLMREVKEEVHLSIKIENVIGIFWFFRQDKDQVVCTTFSCTADDYDIDLSKNPADEDIDEYRWVTKEEFLSDEYEVSHKSIKDLIASL